jgi:phosphatidylglycerol:prolipoprotein diacylglycerol transferase
LHPTLFHLGHLAVPTEGVLVAFGLLAGLQLACLLAPRRGLDPDRLWNLGLAALLTLFLGERMLVIAFNLRDFIEHPFWMLGLAVVRDERYFYGGVLLAICAGAGYILAWRLPWRSVLDTLAPGAGLALACLSFGALAAGTDLGRPTTAAWGLTYTSRIASMPLIPTALYAGLLHLVLAACAVWLCRRERQAGTAATFWLFTAGLGTVLIEQLRYPTPAETLVTGAFTPSQSLGVLAILCAATIWLRPAEADTPAIG